MRQIIFLFPPLKQLMLYPEAVQYLANNKIYHVIEALRRLIKSRDRRCNLDTESCQLEHIFEVYCAERHFTGRKQEWPALLGNSVCSPLNEVVSVPGGYACEGLCYAQDCLQCMIPFCVILYAKINIQRTPVIRG